MIGQLVEENSFVDRPAHNHCPLTVADFRSGIFMALYAGPYAWAKEATETGKEHPWDIPFSGETKQITTKV